MSGLGDVISVATATLFGVKGLKSYAQFIVDNSGNTHKYWVCGLLITFYVHLIVHTFLCIIHKFTYAILCILYIVTRQPNSVYR